MREEYIKPEVEIIEFDSEDVITTSTIGLDENETDIFWILC